jgi:predicted Zn-dependent peptidase
MDLARATLTRGYARGFETAEQLARAVTQLAVHDLPDDYYDRFVGEILAVDAEAVTGAARRWLSTDDLLTVIVGDCERIADSVSALDVGVPIVERPGVEAVASD